MKIKNSEITEWSKGNGIPCHGDFFEGSYKGNLYRAEWYGEISTGSTKPQLMLAADSYIEIKKDDEWEILDTSLMSDKEFNELVNSIRPEIIE